MCEALNNKNKHKNYLRIKNLAAISTKLKYEKNMAWTLYLRARSLAAY